MPDEQDESYFTKNPGDGSCATLLDTTLALSGTLDISVIPSRLRAAFEAMPDLRAAGLGVNDREHETFFRYSLDLDMPSTPAIMHEVRRDDSELVLLGEPPRTFVSPPLCPGELPPAIRDLPYGDVQRYISSPLMLQNRLIGVIFAAFRCDPQVTDSHVRYLERLARLITPVVWNCITHDRFQYGDRRRDALIKLSNAINAAPEFDATLSAAREAIDSLSEEAGCSIDLLENGGERYRVYLAGGPLHPLINVDERNRVLPVAGSPIEWVCEQLRTYESDDLERSTRFKIDVELRDIGIRRYVVTPMIAHGSVIGALFMGSTAPYPAFRVDVWLYENMALQVGLAIESTRQLRKLRVLSEKLSHENVLLREERLRVRENHEMVGRSPVMASLHEAIARIAGMDSTVLITGQTGVGKELVGHAIHAASPRAEQSLIKVNCAAIPETMVESELFGHERGAFTSAVERRIGRFELAHKGTLFLDEIGELSLTVQAKLLRVLQDGEFERVGGSKTIKSNARIIAATNRDLLKSVESGVFRSDLYYRLNVFPIHVPPLDQRRDDIPLLVETFIIEFSRRMGKHFVSVDPASLECLARRPWPGNIRELRHVVERAMILSDGKVLHIECGQHAAHSTPISPVVGLAPSSSSLEAVESEHIRRVLVAVDYVIEGPQGAAVILDLKPSTLRSKMKRLKITRA